MTWNNISKNSTSFSNISKNSTTFDTGGGYLLQENGDFLLAEDGTFINIGLYTEYTNWTKQSKN